MGAAASCSEGSKATTVVDGDASVLERAGRVLLAREGVAASLRSTLDEAGGRMSGPVVVLAPSGSGKSTFVAQVVAALRAEGGYDVVRCVFVGAAEGSTSIVRVLTELCGALREDMASVGLAPAEPGLPDDVLGLSGVFASALRELESAGRRCLVVFDAVNELDGAAARALGWLPYESEATILVTAIRGGANGRDAPVLECLAALERRFAPSASSALVLPPLDESEQSELLGLLCGREATGDERRALASKPDRSSPLYLRLLAPRLGDVAEFPGTVRGVFDELLERVPGPLQRPARDALSAVHVSGGACFASQLADLATTSDAAAATLGVSLSPLVRAVPAHRLSQLRFVTFVHQQARDAVARRWLATPSDAARAHAALAAYFERAYETRGDADAVDDDPALGAQILRRLPAHLVGAGDAAAAKRVLCDPQFGERKCSAGLGAELASDYRAAAAAFPEVGALEDFGECAKANAHVLGRDRWLPGTWAQQTRNARDASAAAAAAVGVPVAFRWRNKDQTRPTCVSTFVSASTLFWAASVSRSGASVACGASDATVRVLDGDGNETALLAGHGDDVMVVAYSPAAEQIILSVARQGGESSATDAFLWDAAAGTKVAAYVVDEGYVSDARWAPDGGRFVLCCGGTCVVFDAATRGGPGGLARLSSVSPPDGRSAACCCFSPDGTALAYAVGDGLFASAIPGGGVPPPPARDAEPSTPASTPTKRDATSGTSGASTPKGRTTRSSKKRPGPSTPKASPSTAKRSLKPPVFARGHDEKINDVDWFDRLAATAGNDNKVVIYDASSGAVLRTVEAHADVVKSVRLVALDGDVVALSASEDRSARATSTSDGASAALRGHSSAVSQVRPFPPLGGSAKCATVGDDGSCRVWDLRRAFGRRPPPGSSSAVSAVVFVKRDRLLVADTSGVLRAYDVDGERELWASKPLVDAPGGHAAITALSLSWDATRVAVAMYTKLHVRSSRDGGPLATFSFPDWVNTCAFGDGVLAAAGDAADVLVWRPDAPDDPPRNVTHPFARKTDSVLAMAIDDRSLVLVTGDNDNRVHIWTEFDSGSHIRTDDLGGWVVSLAFTVAGSVLAATTKGHLYILVPDKHEGVEIVAKGDLGAGAAFAWCGVLGDDLFVTASESKLIHAWRPRPKRALNRGRPKKLLEPVALFPAAARFGSPDGVGGQAGLDNRAAGALERLDAPMLAVGDEAGRLYVLDVDVLALKATQTPGSP